jgi:NitT/TauT family transport system substrate-binding protein
MPIVLYETFRAPFYTPFYLAHALRAYEAEGVDVELGTSPDLETAAKQLEGGEVDVYWGGPMRIMLAHDRDPACDVVGFCEAITRDPFFLIGRAPNPDFQFSDLAGVSLATVSEVPTPWMCLQDDVRRTGLDPDKLTRVTDRTMAENEAALRAGETDVIQVFQPYAENLLSDEAGHIWYVAADRGPCSYTTFYTTRSTLDARRDEFLRMTRAMYRTQKWLHAHSAADIAAQVAQFFPDMPPKILEGLIGRYLGTGIWGRNPILPRAGFERLRDAMFSGGFISREIPYEECVELSLAEAVVAEDPPSM